MKFCRFLFEAINFEPTAIQPCCDVHLIGVPKFTFGGGPLDVDAYRSHINDTFWALQEHSDTCANCPHLIDAEITFDDENSNNVGKYVKLRTVSFNQHRYYCNCRCVYCDLWSKKEQAPVYSVLQSVKSLMASGILDKHCYFSWGGGEPSILKEFDEVCSYISDSNYTQYVHTNALRHSPQINRLLRAGKGLINISLDSASREKYKEVKGVDGWDKVIKTIKSYAATAPDQIELKYIIFEATNQLTEIAAFFELCNSLSIKRVQYSLDFREVNAEKVSQNTLMAAAFFKHHASMSGCAAIPFCIDAPYREKITQLEASL